MKRRLQVGVLLLGLVLVLAIAGCGGGSATGNIETIASKSSSTSAPGKPSGHAPVQGAFLMRAEAICLRANRQIESLKPKNAGREEILRVSPVHAAVETATLKELGQLKPPAAIARQWRQILAYRRTLAGELVELVSAARTNALVKLTTLAGSKAATHKKLLALATRAGFKSCAKVG